MRRALPVSPPAMSGSSPLHRPAPSRVHCAVGVVAALAMSTAACLVAEPHLDPVNMIVVYLAGVVWVALRHGHRPALAAVAGSIVLFDLVFVPPRWSLKPTDAEYLLTFAVMTLIGLLVSHLASRTRAQALMAEERAQAEAALNRLGLALTQARTREEVAQALAAAVQSMFGAQARLLPPGAEPAPPGHAAREPDGADPVERTGLTQPLLAGSGPVGWLAIDVPPDFELDAQDSALLRAVANQGAVALERTVFEQRSTSAALAAEAERLRSTLLAGLSHDFRTPLTTIIGAASSLLDQGHFIDDAQRRALLAGVLDEAQRLHALTSDLLDLTRMEEGAVQPQPEWCPADDLLAEGRAAVEARLAARRLVLQADADAVVWCDPRLFGRALVNLLDNALRHSPAEGTVTARIEADDGHWRLIVQDEGPGLPPGEERAVFEKFRRGGKPATADGTGLGLAICAVVAQLHGGRIDASGHPGGCFVMTLPQPKPPASEVTA